MSTVRCQKEIIFCFDERLRRTLYLSVANTMTMVLGCGQPRQTLLVPATTVFDTVVSQYALICISIVS